MAGGEEADWGFAAQASPVEEVNLGLSYLSDLADSQEELLDEYDDRYAERVDAVSGYADVELDAFMLTAEVVQALDAFAELAPDRDRPGRGMSSWPTIPMRFEGALRLEGSQGRKGPLGWGDSASGWRRGGRASPSRYLQGDFRAKLSEVRRCWRPSAMERCSAVF
jgi:hypothetical protein